MLITDELVEMAVDAARRAGKGCSPLEDMAYVTIRAALAVVVPEITQRCSTILYMRAKQLLADGEIGVAEGFARAAQLVSTEEMASSIRLLGG